MAEATPTKARSMPHSELRSMRKISFIFNMLSLWYYNTVLNDAACNGQLAPAIDKLFATIGYTNGCKCSRAADAAEAQADGCPPPGDSCLENLVRMSVRKDERGGMAIPPRSAARRPKAFGVKNPSLSTAPV
ncbi:hypothetical protein, partial [Telmatospirillum sp.]|uniref:hypothetical protein n=1 Tax=Telmatospirillum sp. TaxID=2079197 RepID=UPI002851BC29